MFITISVLLQFVCMINVLRPNVLLSRHRHESMLRSRIFLHIITEFHYRLKLLH